MFSGLLPEQNMIITALSRDRLSRSLLEFQPRFGKEAGCAQYLAAALERYPSEMNRG
jgi:hypothetical protein